MGRLGNIGRAAGTAGRRPGGVVIPVPGSWDPAYPEDPWGDGPVVDWGPSREPSPLDRAEAYLLLLMLLWTFSQSNTSVNRYADKEDRDDDDCKLFLYKNRKTECKDGISHHIVPDRCWREPGPRGKMGGYYYPQMDEGAGMCICLEDRSKHRLIHSIHDGAEKVLGETGTPRYTTTLGEEIRLGANSVAEVTGCDAARMKEQLENYHDALNLPEETLVRADKEGRSGLSVERFQTVRTQGGVSF